MINATSPSTPIDRDRQESGAAVLTGTYVTPGVHAAPPELVPPTSGAAEPWKLNEPVAGPADRRKVSA